MKARRLIKLLNLAVILSVMLIATPFQIQGAATPTPTVTAGTITLSPASGVVGQTIQVSGIDFVNGGAVSSILFGTTLVQTDYAEVDDAQFSTRFSVPELPRAVYTTKITSDEGDSGSATFTILPSIEVEQLAGKAGDQIVIKGSGFAASSKISLYFDYGSTPLATATTTASGAIPGRLTGIVPTTSAGSHVISVSDAAGNTASDSYSVSPQIIVNPATISSNSEINVSGSGFAPSSPVSIEMDHRLLTSYIKTDSSGALNSVKVTVPAVAAGKHTVSVTDGARNYAEFMVNASSTLVVTPKSGLTGSQFTLSGYGFLPSHPINVDYAGKTLTSVNPVVTADNGSFTATFTAPNNPAGTYTITATDSLNNGTCQFISTSSSGLAVNSGTVGASIPVKGAGFTAGAPISIKFDGVTIAKSSVDQFGGFDTSFTVPARGGGLHKIILTDGINPVSYSFTILPSAQISNSSGSGTQISGHLGSEITVSGFAFTPGGTVNIRYDSREIASPVVDSDGSFSADFEAPLSKTGKHNITVSEGLNQFSFVFIMESTPPGIPMPISPIKDSQNEGLPRFQWTAVSDPSGVLYTLQIASEPSFSAPVLQKNDLVTAAYQLSEDELLRSSNKNQPYYWRVKAVDGVFNESQWSPAYTFSVGHPLPGWIWYICGAVILVLIMVGGYLAGKKWPNMVPQLAGRIKTVRIPLPKFKKKS